MSNLKSIFRRLLYHFQRIRAKYKGSPFSFLFGDKESFSIENRIYNAICLIGLSIGIVSLSWNTFIDLNIWLNLSISFFTIVFIILFYYSRKKQKFSTITFFILGSVGLSLLWFLNDGSNGSIPLLFLIAISSYIAISKRRLHIYFLVGTLANIILLFLAEKYFLKHLVVNYPSAQAREFDIIFGYMASFLLAYIIVSFFKNTYDQENEIINNQKAKLYELNAMKDKLFSIIAHDLRGPFNNIKLTSQLMTDKSKQLSTKDMRRLSSLSGEAADKAYELLGNLLDWAKFHRGMTPFYPDSYPLHSIVSSSVSIYDNMALSKNIKISVNINESVHVFVDKNMLETIIRNLLSNALKFTQIDGQILINSLHSENGSIQFSVQDNGIGMNEHILDNLFQIDIPTNREGTEGEQSTGLGLIICNDFIQRMEGTISVESEANKGCTVIISLPNPTR